ncbi:Choline/ethanolamine kinase, partial [Operophtera brumata]
MKIAEKMAAIHSMDVPLSKEPTWLWKTMGKWTRTVREERLSENIHGKKEPTWLWKTMGKWTRTVREERLSENIHGKNEVEQNIINRLKSVDFEKEVEWLKKFIVTVESPVAFCHNDMQEEWLKKFIATVESPVAFCHNDMQEDFEYCSYNYRGFDIANHFQEWAFDYTNPEHPFYFERYDDCPTLEQK